MLLSFVLNRLIDVGWIALGKRVGNIWSLLAYLLILWTLSIHIYNFVFVLDASECAEGPLHVNPVFNVLGHRHFVIS